MSRTAADADDVLIECGSEAGPAALERFPARIATVGAAEVRRILPQRGRRTVGAWCFADHFGPSDGMFAIGPHPHIGLQTVTWLLEGELLHRDSLGSEQPIRPGQLNLMTAGRGVTHAEELLSDAPMTGHGVQLWVAQPDATRHGDPAFEHHAELPRAELAGAEVTVLVGELGGVTSPARADTRHLGAQLALHGPTTVPLRAADEHVLIPLDGPIGVEGTDIGIGEGAYLATGRHEVTVSGPAGSRVLLLGGEPWEDRVKMWWNFVGRTLEDVDGAYEDWQARHERFGTVTSGLARIDAPTPPWRR